MRYDEASLNGRGLTATWISDNQDQGDHAGLFIDASACIWAEAIASWLDMMVAAISFAQLLW